PTARKVRENQNSGGVDSARCQSVPRRRSSQSLGATAPRRHPHRLAPSAAVDAREQNDLLAPSRVGSPRGPRSHDGTIIPTTVDTMWGTDLTTTITAEGRAAVFIAVDHCSAECVGIHADARATRFQALEPIRQGVRQHFGGFAKAIAGALSVRHDHGSQYMSDAFQKEIAFLGIESSPAFVRAPEGKRHALGRRRPAVFRHGGADRELPGRCVSWLCEPVGSGADRSASLRPEAWAADAARRRQVRVPEPVTFATKPQIACDLIAAALDAGTPAHGCWRMRCMAP